MDPLAGPAFALTGRVVTMVGRDRVLPRATVYVEDGSIAAVARRRAGVPERLDRMALVQPPEWRLALDELEDTGMTVRPRLPHPGTHVADR